VSGLGSGAWGIDLTGALPRVARRASVSTCASIDCHRLCPAELSLAGASSLTLCDAAAGSKPSDVVKCAALRGYVVCVRVHVCSRACAFRDKQRKVFVFVFVCVCVCVRARVHVCV
jgi:hypothetical protein